MKRLYLSFFIISILALLPSCTTFHNPYLGKKNMNKNPVREDPLIGTIIRAKSAAAIDFDDLVNEIAQYDVIYLSEKHDNPDIHDAQEKIIHALIQKKFSPTLAFEFFAMDDTPDILNFIDSGKVKHSEKNEKFIEAHLRKKLGWETQSDRSWGFYYSLLEIARANRLAAAGIDLSATLKKRITRKGLNGITPVEKEMLFSTQLENNIYKAYMVDIFKTVHCGMGHGRMQERLYDTWVARNDKMAHSIVRLAAHHKGPVIVIIGGGHTEYGLGVIDRVRSLNSAIRQTNVGLREITINETPLLDYLAPLELETFDAVPQADYLWFFQRVSYADPCEAFKESLKRMKRAGK